MNVELNRLFTFNYWPLETPIEPESLAKSGFFATATDWETECYWCHKKISDWQYGDQPMERHRSLNPLCPFVLNPTECGNVAVPVPPIAELPDIDLNDLSTIAQHLDLKNESCRLSTFGDWPNQNISPESLARAGFYYLQEADQVACAWCKGVIAKWERNDDALQEHKRFFPDCPFVKLGALVHVGCDGMSDLGIQQACPPKRPKYSSLDARLRTYDRWPVPEIQRPNVLSEAGFYYQHINDQVRCFHCNGGLRSWQRQDDPWFEHAKWFPHCQFVRLVKGPLYVTNVQRQTGRQTKRERKVTLEEAMRTEPVRRALEMGYSESKIRYMTIVQMQLFGKPYQSAEELINSVVKNGKCGIDAYTDENALRLSELINTIYSSEDGEYDSSNRINNNLSNDADENDPSADNVPQQSVESQNAIEHNSDSTNNPSERKCTCANCNNCSTANETASASNAISPSSSSTGSTEENNSGNVSTSLIEENRKLKDARLCKICMDDEVGVVNLPCGHLVTCVQCAPGVSHCPLCRQEIKAFVRTFLP